MKEKSLSDKIIQDSENDYILLSKDVKDFISKLKDSMATFSANRSNGMQILNHFWKEIDTLVGENLIGK